MEGSVRELSVEEIQSVSGGATAIEYGLIAAGIAVVIISAVQSIGNSLTDVFKSVDDSIK